MNVSRDLRTEKFDYLTTFANGDVLVMKGNVVQAHWFTDVLGRAFDTPQVETWTLPTHAQALDSFNDMKERFANER